MIHKLLAVVRRRFHKPEPVSLCDVCGEAPAEMTSADGVGACTPCATALVRQIDNRAARRARQRGRRGA